MEKKKVWLCVREVTKTPPYCDGRKGKKQKIGFVANDTE
jgi:CDGSH-type Zn-finger protein